MIARADDAVLFCLIAAALVVLAHMIDALGSRRGDGDGWANSLALALCGLALGLVAIGAVFSTSRTDLLLTLSTAAAVVVSAMPLVGLRVGEDDEQRPVNPWDRAFRVRRSRVAQLLSPTPHPRPAPAARPAATPMPGMTQQAREGVVLPPAGQMPGRSGTQARSTPPPPEVHEAEETLNDVGEVVGDLGRLLGLDRRDRRGR